MSRAPPPAATKRFDELTINENKPNSVPAGLLLNGILNDAYEAPNGQYEAWDQYYLNNYDYYGNNRYDFGAGATYYTTLKNVGLMEQQALAAGQPAVNPYAALAEFFRAYLFTRMSLEMGDIPQTEALQGLAQPDTRLRLAAGRVSAGVCLAGEGQHRPGQPHCRQHRPTWRATSTSAATCASGRKW